MPEPWTIEANGAESIVETYGYLTDVIAGQDETEQRVSLRALPVESIEYSVLCTSARESQLADTLVYAFQDEQVVVPYWQYGSRLTAPVAPTDTLLPITDALDVPYRPSGYAMIWRDPFTVELVGVTGTSGSGVACDPVGGNWPAGTLVFPARFATITSKVGIDRESGAFLSGRLIFSGDTAEPTTVAAETLPLYRTLPVLEVAPDAGGRDQVERKLLALDPKPGIRLVFAPSAAPRTVREFRWLCFSRAEARALRNFIDSRRGRARPFWVLAWQQDFTLAIDHGGGSGTLTVVSRDDVGRSYALLVFPLGQGRRHLGIRAPGGAFSYRQVTAAVDNLNGTETLTLDAPVSDALPAAGTLVSFLRLSRLETDEPRIEWEGGQYAAATLPFRELPNEAA